MAKKAKPGYKLEKWFFRKEIEIPEEWELKKIKDIAKVSVGLVINPSTYFDADGTVPMITGKNVTTKGLVLDDVDYISEKSNRLLETSRIWSGDLVTMRVGYPGRTSIVKNENDGINCASVIITRKNKKYISQFLCSLANSIIIKKQILMHKAGGAQQVVNIRSWKNFLIPLPSITEQQKIASILSNIDNVISIYEDSIDSTKNLKIGLMNQLFARGIGHKKFKKIKGLFQKEIEIPENWEVKNFDELFEFIISATNSRKELGPDGDVYYIHYGDIHTQWNKLILDCTSEKIPLIEKTKVERIPLLKEGDLIITDVSEDYEGSGTSILLKNVKNKKIIAGLHTFALRTDNETIPIDFRRYITSNRFVKRQIISYVTGTSVLGISKNNFKKINIFLPELDEQQKIASILVNVDENLNNLEKKKTSFENLKIGLIQKLLTGQMRVTA